MIGSGHGVENRFPGVYYVTGIVDIKMQLVVASELEGEEFVSLRVQSKRAVPEDIRRFIGYAEKLTDKMEIEMAGLIALVSMNENEWQYDLLREEWGSISRIKTDAFFRLYGDLIEEKINSAKESNSEEIATNMIKEQMPAKKIEKCTSIPISRLKKLEEEQGIALV